MPPPKFTSQSASVPSVNFNGGLNTTGGPLSLKDSESPDLQNVDFNKFGSVVKRNGYTTLNSSAMANSPEGDGLHWFELDVSGVETRFAVAVADGKLWKMDNLDGTWDDVTGALTITGGNHCDFENFLNEVFITNNEDVAFKWTGTGNGAVVTGMSTINLDKAKWIKQFNNFLFVGNVDINGTRHNSRIYWSAFNDATSWPATNFIDISKNDGQDILGMKVLADRLVVYKSRSIYNVFFTGDANIPFIVQKSNSEVGCASGYTVQNVKNGHVFMSQDGFYFYDGSNSFKISDKITDTLLGFVDTRFDKVVSMNQLSKNRYWVALTSSGQTENDRVLVWDYFSNAWTLYKGISAAAMAVFYVSGTEERPYFMDYSGFAYRADTGTSDHPDGTTTDTAIDASYTSNWRAYGDLVNQKGVPHLHVYYQNANTTMTFAYSYNFESGDTYQQTFSLATSTDVYGTGAYGTAVYAGGGGATVRRDLTGRGRVIRLKFSNSIVDEIFQIDGLGQEAYLETNV
jgi:hypothetical protein